MFSISHQSIEERLNIYLTGLTNARDAPELQSRVACEDAAQSFELLGITVKAG